MKPYKPLLLILTLVYALSAVAQDTTYFDNVWNPTTAAKAYFYRTKAKKDGVWQVSDHYVTGIVQMTGTYTDDSLKVRQGEFVYQDTVGHVFHRHIYVNGKSEGPDLWYYPDGKMQIKGQYSNNKKTGEWLGYYPDGKLSARAAYDTGRQVSMVAYNEDGSENGSVTVFMRDAAYPGGQTEYMRFLNHNLRYPDKAVKRNIEGIVVVAFKISKEGKISDIAIAQSVDKLLDNEALRVMRLMPDWMPAIMGGVLTEAYPRQPVVFKFQ